MGKGEMFVAAICMFLFFMQVVLAVESTVNMSIENSPPAQIKTIRDYAWENGTFSNAFDLDNYFKDWEEDVITYSVYGDDVISVGIDSNNMVSFNAIQTEIEDFITINATDGQFTTSSNMFRLFVGKDIIPPKWSDPSKDRIKVFKNSVIKFSADWTDDRSLEKYYLLINEGPGWIYHQGTFSGVENTSENSVRVSAEVGETVFWKICAEDTVQNLNCTDVYEFPIRPDEPPEQPPEDAGEGLNGSVENSTTESKETQEIEEKPQKETMEMNKFEVNAKAFLVSLKQGLSETQTLEITNTGSNNLDFNLAIQSLEEFVSPDIVNFNIGAGESKKIALKFKAPITAKPKDYYGNLVISSAKTVVIPIALNINQANLNYEVLVEVQDEIVKPGKTVSANIIIRNHGDKVPIKANLYYAIKDYYGIVYNFSDEEISFDSEIILDKELTVPKETMLGEYLFYSSIENEKTFALNSDSFTIGTRLQLQALLKYSIAFLIILLLSIISLVLIHRYNLHKKRYRSINLYVKLSEMKDLVKDKKYDKAAQCYIDIKKIYGEKVSKEELNDKTKLSKAMESLAKKINFEDIIKEATKPTPKTVKPVVPAATSKPSASNTKPTPVKPKVATSIPKPKTSTNTTKTTVPKPIAPLKSDKPTKAPAPVLKQVKSKTPTISNSSTLVKKSLKQTPASKPLQKPVEPSLQKPVKPAAPAATSKPSASVTKPAVLAKSSSQKINPKPAAKNEKK